MTARLLVVEHEPDAGLSLMAAHLGERVHVVRPYLGESLPEADSADSDRGGRGYAGLIVLGGSMGAWDDEVAPWLPATRRLLADAVRAELPTLGICLGAQLLAAACGGTAERGEPGLELGLAPVTPLAAAAGDPFFGAVADAIAPGQGWSVLQYHYDAIIRLPADAELVVTGNTYPNQGFRVGAAAWGVQYHPEVSTSLFTDWVANGLRDGSLPEASGAVLDPVQRGWAAQSRLAAAHAQAFLSVAGRRPDLQDLGEVSVTEKAAELVRPGA